MSSGRNAFSLLEVVLVVTLAAVVVSMTTLGMADISGESKLRAAATDLASLLRLGRSQADMTGRPVAMRFGPSHCELLQPVARDGQWVLVSVVHRDFAESVFVERLVFGNATKPLHTDNPIEEVWVHPKEGAELAVDLRVGQGRRATAIIDAWVGLQEIVYMDGE